MNNKQVMKNAFSSVLIYGALLIFSIITSRFVLVKYGSEVNGLLSSVNQLFSYIALLEAGIGTATVNALYKPLSERNATAIQDVLASSRCYYRTSAKWYLFCALIIAFCWPCLIDTDISAGTIIALIFLRGISGVITFWYSSTIVQYLLASGKNYINNRVHIFTTLVAYALKVAICFANMNIVFISVSMIVVNTLQCAIYSQYMKKHCPDYFIPRTPNTRLLKQRNAFLVHEISGAIFYSTDTIVLSIFCGLKEASVYAVYSMVLSALESIAGQGFHGTHYILGNAYAHKRENYEEAHDLYNSIYMVIVFAVFTVTYIMLLPFIALYTQGVTDVPYLDHKLPLLFVLIRLLSSCRMVDNQLIAIALHAKQTISRTITEAAINLVASLVLVQFIGIYGVLCGTILALLYRSNDIVLYANHKILHRSAKKEYLLYAVNFSVFAMFVLMSRKLFLPAASYWQLLAWAVLVSVVVAVVYILVNLATNVRLRNALCNLFRKHLI